jgi:hypothetical protein
MAMADSATMPTVDRVLVQMKFDDLPEIDIEETGDMEETVAEEPVDDSNTEAVVDEEVPTDGDEASE